MNDWYNPLEPSTDERIRELETTLLKVADLLDVSCKVPDWNHPRDSVELPE